jgi:kinesin family protein C1
MKSSIPKPLSTGINANKRKTPSSPAVPAKRVVSNPLAQSTAGPRKPTGFVPTTRKASATLGSATTISRPTSSLAASTRRTASSAAGPSNLGSRAGSSTVGARGAPVAARRPPAASTTRPAVGRAGSRGISPGMGASGMAQNNVSSHHLYI